MGSAQGTAETAIRVRLAAKKKSQRWLAEQLEVSTYWLSRRMSGRKSFDVDDLDRIAEVFGTDFIGLVQTETAA